MAATSASRRWAFARRAAAIGAVAAAGLIAVAIPASAHVPVVNAGCDGEVTTLTVTLTKYADQDKNTIKVVEGKDNILADTHFGASYSHEFRFADGAAHDFVVTVHASDDQQFSFEKKLHAAACKKTPPSSSSSTQPTTTTKPPSSSSSSSAPATVPPVTTTSTPAVVANASLASTGASVALPLAIGALLLVGGGVLLLLMRKRGKA
jgi:LPXTG-motif cell wall-anchored protein